MRISDYCWVHADGWYSLTHISFQTHCYDISLQYTDTLQLMSNTTILDKYCRECDSEPCLWYDHKEVVIAGVENWILIQDANGGTRYSPNECRKFCYQQCVRAIHGILGRGERLQLPECVIAQVPILKIPVTWDSEMRRFEKWIAIQQCKSTRFEYSFIVCSF